MKCSHCHKNNLLLIYFDNFDYLCEWVNEKWQYKDPGVRDYYFSGRRAAVRCQDCHHDMPAPNVEEIVSPKINNSEITLDLDQTLFYCEQPDYLDKFDFSFSDPENKYTYNCAKRPHLEKFIEFCVDKFDKINFFTAAVDWYAEHLINSLNIPKNKLGFVKTRKDTQTERPLSFEWELMKPMSHSLMVDDKPLVIKGLKNRVFKIKPFYPGPNQDDELLRIMDNLNRDNLVFAKPKTHSGEVCLFLQKISIDFEKISEELVNKILSLPKTTELELKKMKVHTQLFDGYITIENNVTNIELVGLNFDNYLVLMKLLEGHTAHQTLTRKQYNALGGQAWSRKNFNF